MVAWCSAVPGGVYSSQLQCTPIRGTIDMGHVFSRLGDMYPLQQKIMYYPIGSASSTCRPATQNTQLTASTYWYVPTYPVCVSFQGLAGSTSSSQLEMASGLQVVVST